MNGMLTTVVKGIAGHRRRFLASCTAVLLGVTFLTGTLVLGDTVERSFADMFTEANQGTAVIVRSSGTVGSSEGAQRGVVDAATVARVADVAGVASSAAVVQGPTQVVGADGDVVERLGHRARPLDELGQPGVVEHDRGLGVGDEVLDLGRRVGRVHRQQHGPGPDAGQVREHGLGRLLDLQRHPLAPRDAEGVGELGRAPVDVAVGEAGAAGDLEEQRVGVGGPTPTKERLEGVGQRTTTFGRGSPCASHSA